MPDYHHERYDQAEADAILVSGAGALRLDANESVFFARQLDFVKSKTYDIQYPPMSGSRLVPQTSDVPVWAESYTYRAWDWVGMAKIIANYADDLPRVDVRGTEYTVRIRPIGDSYGFNMQEIRASQATGANLDVRKASAARRAIEQKLNSIAMRGDVNFGLMGLITHPNIGLTVVTGGWSLGNASPDQMLADLNSLYAGVVAQSNGIHYPSVFCTSPRNRVRLFTSRLSNTTETVGDFFVKQIRGLQGAETFNIEEAIEFQSTTPGADIGLMYERNSDNISQEVPEAFTQWPAQMRNLEWVIVCTARSAGVQIYYPLAFTKANNL